MTLTGNTVQSTYLDLVQLEQSGAGLPSHAGAEARIFDGDGNLVVGRTAIRHWENPAADAAGNTGTFEFATDAPKSQAQLESDGWSFTNCTAVSNGRGLICTSTGTNGYAEYDLTLSGDFFFEFHPPTWEYGDQIRTYIRNCTLNIADTSGGTGYTFSYALVNATSRFYVYSGDSSVPQGGQSEILNGVGGSGAHAPAFVFWRSSGTLYYGITDMRGALVTTSINHMVASSSSTSVTFNKLRIGGAQNLGNSSGDVWGVQYIRRYA